MSTMSLEEVVTELGVTSEKTVENWLCGGHFPGATCSDGVWTFDGDEVAWVKRKVEETREKNRCGDLTVADCGDDATEPPLL